LKTCYAQFEADEAFSHLARNWASTTFLLARPARKGLFWTVFSGACLVHGKGTSTELFAVQRADSCSAFCGIAHRYKREAARPTGLSIAHDVSFCNSPKLFKDTPKVSFRSIEREVSNIEFHGAIRVISDCQLQSRSRGPDFKSPSRESHLTIYRALNQGKQSAKMLAQVDKASESVFGPYQIEVPA